MINPESSTEIILEL